MLISSFWFTTVALCSGISPNTKDEMTMGGDYNSLRQLLEQTTDNVSELPKHSEGIESVIDVISYLLALNAGIGVRKTQSMGEGLRWLQMKYALWPTAHSSLPKKFGR